MLRTGQSPAPSTGRSSSASTPGSRPTPGVLLPGTLASPRTGLTPAGCRELVARLRRGALLSVLLGARAPGRTFRRNQEADRMRAGGVTLPGTGGVDHGARRGAGSRALRGPPDRPSAALDPALERRGNRHAAA